MVDECQISRAYSDEVCVMLPCGYRQRFFTTEKEDTELIEICKTMKDKGVERAQFAFEFQPPETWPF